MKYKFLYIVLVVLLICTKIAAQKADIRISGKVYMNYSKKAVVQKSTKTYKKYVSDFKVMLVYLYVVAETGELEKQKREICSNDKKLLSKYKVMVSYTDKEGKYEFKGLQRQANYVLIFCDRTIQVSQVQTGDRYITYALRDKSVVL